MTGNPDIQQALKIALDETRMLVMGVQILIGFQFEAVVQDAFTDLPASSTACVGAALVLMVCTAGLAIAPAAQHRLVERGDASRRIIAVTTRLMKIALFVLAIGIALDVYVAMERIVGFRAALTLGIAAFLIALLCWYAFGLMFSSGKVKEERAVSQDVSQDVDQDVESTPLSKKIDYMLTESRVVLPGVQALLGFQLIAVLTREFDRLPAALKLAHAVGLGMMTLSIVLLLAPAAFHRLGFGGEDVPIVHTVGSIFVTAALAALAIGLGAETMVAIGALSHRLDLGALIGALALLILLGFWYAWPLAMRARLRSAKPARVSRAQRGTK